MYAVDFEYDGQYLSDYGLVICDFNNGSGVEVVSAGSKITFNTTPRNRGKIHSLTGTKYGECISTSFSICKDPCLYDDLRITNDEYRDVMRWLNRNEFHRFRLVNNGADDVDTCFFDGSFNIDKVLFDGEIYGMALTLTTNRPFGYGPLVYVDWEITDTSVIYEIKDESDEIGYIYPDMKVTVANSGNLVIQNSYDNNPLIIKNCVAGEVITIHGEEQIIETSKPGHKIYNDFNYEFVKIGNDFDNRQNLFSVSLPCELEIWYNPIVKDTPV